MRWGTLAQCAATLSVLGTLGTWTYHGVPPTEEDPCDTEEYVSTAQPREVAVAVSLPHVLPNDETLISLTLFNNERLTPVLMQPGEAQEAIDPSEPVIGVYLAGRTRAYRKSAFASDEAGAVNDLFGNMPVTVAHDPDSGTTRVFGGEPDTRIVMRAVEQDGQRHLWCRGKLYTMDDPGIPFIERRFTVTTWGEWHTKYPESALCVGVYDYDRETPSRESPLAGEVTSSDLGT